MFITSMKGGDNALPSRFQQFAMVTIAAINNEQLDKPSSINMLFPLLMSQLRVAMGYYGTGDELQTEYAHNTVTVISSDKVTLTIKWGGNAN